MDVTDDNIVSFWQWFVKNENNIKECIENENSVQTEYVVEQMNEQILSFGVLTWDVGLNDDDNWFLMLSPNGNFEMLKVSEKIMNHAPEHMNWLFYGSRPAKKWDRKFTVYDSYMDEQFIDASQWNYIVFEEDGKLELIIEANNIPRLDPEVLETAGEKFVIQEIGEAKWMMLISSIDIVEMLESEDEPYKKSVANLKEHLG